MADARAFASFVAAAQIDGRFTRRRKAVDPHARWLGKLHYYSQHDCGGVFTAAEVADLVATLHAAGVATPAYFEPGATSLAKLTSLAQLE